MCNSRFVSDETWWKATPFQLSLWIHSELAGDRALYNMSRAYALRGDLNRAAFEAAIRLTTQRQNVLRTRMRLVGDDLVQQVIDEEPIVEFVDAHALADAAFEKYVDGVAARPFNLSESPPVRWALLRRSAYEHVFVFVVHHAACDGHSLDIIVSDVWNAYVGRPLPALRPDEQFAAFAGEFAPANENAPQLSAATATIEWPSSTAGNPAALEEESAAVVRRLTLTMSASLRAAAAAQYTSPFVLFLTAFGTALRRATGAPQVLAFVPHGHHSEPYARTAGYFIRPMAVDAGEGETPAERIRNTRDSLLEAMESAEQMRGGKQPASRFSVCATMEYTGLETLSGNGIEAHLLDDRRTSKFDLSIAVQERADGFRLYFDYRRRVFADSWVERFADEVVSDAALLIESSIEHD